MKSAHISIEMLNHIPYFCIVNIINSNIMKKFLFYLFTSLPFYLQ